MFKPNHLIWDTTPELLQFHMKAKILLYTCAEVTSNFSRSELLQEAYPGCSKYDYQTEMVGLAVIKYLPGLSDDVVYIHLFESLLS